MEKLWCARAGDSSPTQRDAADEALREATLQGLWKRLRQVSQN